MAIYLQMKKINLTHILSLIIILSLTNCNKDEALDPVDEYDNNDSTSGSDTIRNDAVFCEEYATVNINDSYYLHNNVWGFYAASYDSAFTQCIFYDTIQPSNIGWKWELEGTSKYPSYPRVGYGWNPWFEESTSSELPMKIGALSSVTSSFDFDYSFSGKYNTSFDIWLTSSEIPHEDNISAEIMIWLDANTLPETPITIENLLIENKTYSFYKNTDWYDYPFFVFLQKDTSWNGQFSIYPFLRYLLDNNHISNEYFLADIEFGNEIWSGTGCMEIENYKIEIK